VPLTQQRFFIALLPPPAIQTDVTAIKQIFADRYQSRAALKSPPHITLYPPFEWSADDLPKLSQALTQFASQQPPLTLQLSGFGSFAPRVIFVDVIRSPALQALQQELLAHTDMTLGLADPVSKTRPFTPHMTVGFRDLSCTQFHSAWAEFQHRPFEREFTATQLTLLIHNGQRWIIYQDFPFLGG
jgi:2'-5' RNA ligase